MNERSAEVFMGSVHPSNNIHGRKRGEDSRRFEKRMQNGFFEQKSEADLRFLCDFIRSKTYPRLDYFDSKSCLIVPGQTSESLHTTKHPKSARLSGTMVSIVIASEWIVSNRKFPTNHLTSFSQFRQCSYPHMQSHLLNFLSCLFVF